MLLTFQSTKEPDSASKEREPTPRNPKDVVRGGRRGRRGAVPRACASCRRRKIKCNGEKPCEACRWYKRPLECAYPDIERDRATRTSPSPDYRSALTRLFPSTAPEQLVELPREKLLKLINGSASSQMQDSPTATNSVGTASIPSIPVLPPDRPTLESLHSIPRDELDNVPGAMGAGMGIPMPPTAPSSGHISDDVNALSLLARPPTSYLGISSVQAALRAIAWNHPEHNFAISPAVSRQQPEEPLSPLSATLATLQFSETQLVDAYFSNFHALAPLIDEDAFRRTHQANSRQDARWIALRDTVFALGSIIAAPDVHDRAHASYFESATSQINLGVLGNPSIEVVQTLALMGGWYCHYTSQPNLAYALMGTAIRMALTLGLHRELCDSRPVYEAGGASRAAHEDFRRRVWWSLCCLETWGQETLGRPGMDFFTASITAAAPRLVDKDNYQTLTPLIENISFIKIASKIQESLATPPALTHTEMCSLDALLLSWWTNLPPLLTRPDPPSHAAAEPEPIYSVRTVMRWRFHMQRMLLFRPTLLNQTMRRIPLIALRHDERTAIQRCREAAETVIADIAQTTRMNRMIGWNAVWFVFQATMVPLIYLSGIGIAGCGGAAAAGGGGGGDGWDGGESEEEVEACKRQVEMAILALGRMRPFSPTAGRTFEVLSSIFAAVQQQQQEKDTVDPDAGAPLSGVDADEQMEDSALDRMAMDSSQNAVAAVIEQGFRGGRSADEAAGFFDNLPPEYMWEYLSWGPNDLWPDLATLGQEEGIPFNPA
ncbi:fungal-specific transcription factor domain-containing protein [Aspergillus heterothallicus]